MENNPPGTARHALKLLVPYRSVPTSNNFASIFYETASNKPDAGPQGAERMVLVRELREQFARTAERCLPVLDEDDASIGPAIRTPIRACRPKFEGLGSLNSKLFMFNHRLSLAAEDQDEIRRTLLSLLQLVFESIAGLSLDDRWLCDQIEVPMKASETPVSLRRLDDL